MPRVYLVTGVRGIHLLDLLGQEMATKVHLIPNHKNKRTSLWVQEYLAVLFGYVHHIKSSYPPPYWVLLSVDGLVVTLNLSKKFSFSKVIRRRSFTLGTGLKNQFLRGFVSE